VAGDSSLRAILSVRANARMNGLRVDARRGDLFTVAHAYERFDVILANPPYLPVAEQETCDARWDAGSDGRLVLDRIIDGVGGLLKPAARLVLVQSALAGIQATLERLYENRLEVVRLIEHEGLLGPIAMARRENLARIGALDRGSTRETLIVLTARHISSAPRPEALLRHHGPRAGTRAHLGQQRRA
jgi:release factor glutamine methyltransferase